MQRNSCLYETNVLMEFQVMHLSSSGKHSDLSVCCLLKIRASALFLRSKANLLGYPSFILDLPALGNGVQYCHLFCCIDHRFVFVALQRVVL